MRSVQVERPIGSDALLLACAQGSKPCFDNRDELIQVPLRTRIRQVGTPLLQGVDLELA